MTNIDNKKIGNLIKKLRSDANVSCAYLAEQLDVSKVIVGQWEKGNKGCSITNLCKLADLFRVSVQELVDGKLHDEGTIDYLNRNFDISCFDVDELIKNKNKTGLENYLEKCLSIKYRFFYGLLEKWSKDQLTKSEKEEFEYIKKYVSFDTRIFGDKYKTDIHSIIEHKEDLNLKACVKEYFNGISDLESDSKHWEIDKLINFNFDFRAVDIINLGFEDCTTYVLYLCNQQYLDELLALNLENKSNEELGGNENIGAIVACGGNCVYRFMKLPSIIWDEEIIAKAEGSLIEDDERTAAWESCLIPGFNMAGRVQIYGYKDEWKTMSYEQYAKTIMTKKTKYIEDLCNLKYINPKVYYQRLINGEYDTY